jgi:hypothetical protein
MMRAGARGPAAHRRAGRTSRRPPGRARRRSPGRSCVAVANAGCVCPRGGEGTPAPCQTRRHSHPHPHRLYPGPTRCRPPIPRLRLSQTRSRQTRSDRRHGARPALSGHPRREVLGRAPRSNRNESTLPQTQTQPPPEGRGGRLPSHAQRARTWTQTPTSAATTRARSLGSCHRRRARNDGRWRDRLAVLNPGHRSVGLCRRHAHHSLDVLLGEPRSTDVRRSSRFAR